MILKNIFSKKCLYCSNSKVYVSFDERRFSASVGTERAVSTTHSTPLGFSDLNQDERFVICVFRAWRRLGPTRAIAEHKIASSLQAEKSHAALGPLFRLFGEFSTKGHPDEEETDLLSDIEEAFLDLLSDHGHPDDDLEDVRMCKGALAAADIKPRSPRSINRSGHDRLMLRVAESFQVACRQH